MAKNTHVLDRRGVKDWFAGLSFDAQQAVLNDFSSSFETSKVARISALEKELVELRGVKPVAKAVPRNGSPMKGTKVPPKYANDEGQTWAGRGVQPTWIREYLKKRGNKLDDLLVSKK